MTAFISFVLFPIVLAAWLRQVTGANKTPQRTTSMNIDRIAYFTEDYEPISDKVTYSAELDPESLSDSEKAEALIAELKKLGYWIERVSPSNLRKPPCQ